MTDIDPEKFKNHIYAQHDLGGVASEVERAVIKLTDKIREKGIWGCKSCDIWFRTKQARFINGHAHCPLCRDYSQVKFNGFSHSEEKSDE